ncbi:hypothetical protein BaRGS_00036381 [Batillaria attramentaria]|uniref:IgGFc-binding protein N-terminal domain-containing protein n=1 Tax=Batillaria attramentaria TaxID=370345 RepID=A0ABD0JBW3_9CAEN
MFAECGGLLAVVLLPLMFITPIVSQGTPVLSTEGREFLVYPSRVDDLWDRVNLYITTHATRNIMVRVTTPVLPVAYGGVDHTFAVSVDQPRVQEIKTRGTNAARGKLMDAIRVEAEEDIAVFVNNPSDNATGVTSILSRASLGNDYLFPSIQRTFNGQVSICVGNLETVNTVWVTLPSRSNQGGPLLDYKGTVYWPGDTITIRLTSFEFADIRDVTSTADLTGTVIRSETPVSVFSAAVFHKTISSADSKDIVIENIPPKRAWGKKFVVTASPSATPGDSIRVLGKERDVSLEFSFGDRDVIQEPGQFLEKVVAPGTSFTITADKPVEVVQYRYSFTEDSAPFMFLVPHLESYGKEFTVPIIFNEEYVIGSQNYIVLITHACHADRVTIRHRHAPQEKKYVSRLSSWEPVGDGSYVTTQIKVTEGFVTIAMEPSVDPLEDELVVVGGYFFGQGPQKAYAAPLGLHVQDVNPVFSFSLPVDRLRNAPKKEPIVDGHSKLVARGKLPLAFSLDAREVKSRVACHRECWTMPNCLYVAYSKARNADSSDCRLFGPTAQCSGLKDSPGFLLYKLSKYG